MAGQSILISLMLNVLLGLTLCSNPESETYKCCMPDQWGGTLFISSGTSIVFFNWTIYTNGTAVFAYDKKLGKLYLGMEVIHHSPQLPQNPHINWTILYDNKKVGTTKQISI